MNQLNWRRGGAFGERAELPIEGWIICAGKDAVTAHFTGRLFYDHIWPSVFWWVSESDLLATIPKEQA